MLTLALDAATYTGTVAVLDGTRLLATREVAMRDPHEERLLPAVADAMAESNVSPAALGGIVCGSGPGSFTSLRIAASIAKGLALATEVPLYAVSSLLLTVAGSEYGQRPGTYAAVLDAMRGDVFLAVIEVAAGRLVQRAPAMRVARRDLSAIAAGCVAQVVGPHEDHQAWPHARGVARLLEQLLAEPPVDLDGWEPNYGRLAEAQVKWEAAHGQPLPR